MIKIGHIIGARPQFLKFFAVSTAFEEMREAIGYDVRQVVIHTGQHYDYSMSKIFFDEIGIRQPNYHLSVGSGSHGEQTARIIQEVEAVLNNENIDIVFVYGDTNTTLGGALAATKIHIPVAHVEAGLRSFNKYMAEEINGIVTDHVSTLLFCPSKRAVENLMKEGFRSTLNEGDLISVDFPETLRGIKADKNNPLILNVGDVMQDVLLYSAEIGEKESKILERLQLRKKDYCLLRVHRAETTEIMMNLERIIDFVNILSECKRTIFPMHPRTKHSYEKSKRKLCENIEIIEPLSYFDIVMLLRNSYLVMTDSGGMQKEAYWLKVPCVTLRNETDWVETVESGWNVLYRDFKEFPEICAEDKAPYGDGKASIRIKSTVISFLDSRNG